MNVLRLEPQTICSHRVKVTAENAVLAEMAAAANSVSPFISAAMT